MRQRGQKVKPAVTGRSGHALGQLQHARWRARASEEQAATPAHAQPDPDSALFKRQSPRRVDRQHLHEEPSHRTWTPAMHMTFYRPTPPMLFGGVLHKGLDASDSAPENQSYEEHQHLPTIYVAILCTHHECHSAPRTSASRRDSRHADRCGTRR